MEKYNVHVCGTVKGTDTDFKMGFDITVENGGSVSQVANALQNTIDTLSKNASKVDKPTEE